MIDVVVVGGGPIGLASAVDAARAGMSVAVMEPRSTPVDKACGEGLMPAALESLGRIGVDPAGVALHGIMYVQGGRRAVGRFSAGPGRGVRRTELHNALAQRAADLGVQFIRTRVTEISQSGGAVQAQGVRAGYLIAADGLHSTVRRRAGLERAPSSRAARRFGVRQHYRVAPWADLVEVHWARDREAYVTPVGPDTVGVAVLGASPVDLAQTMADLPELAQHLRGATKVSAARGAGPLHQRATARVSGRIVLVGDAAGYVDAITGEGLRLGLLEAAAAVDCIRHERLAAYEAQWRRITRSYRVLTTGLLWCAARPPLRRAIVPTAQALPRVFAAAVDSVAR